MTWRPIDAQLRYWVSDEGEVWSSFYERTMSPFGHKGYTCVVLAGRGRQYVHQLVLQTFVGCRPPRLECRHLDGNRSNNRLSNLAWGTSAENYADQVRMGRRPIGERNTSARLTAVLVSEARSLHAAGWGWKRLSKRFGVDKDTIRSAVLRLTWRHVDGPGGAP